MIFNFLKKLGQPHKNPIQESLTINKLKKTLESKSNFIQKEFTKGLNLISKHPRSVTFFGSARTSEDQEDYKKAQRLAFRIVRELGYSVVTGGGPGIMEAANRGAHQAGGESVGLNIQIPDGQADNPYINSKENFYYFFSRKVCLSFSAETFLFFPGGLGTFDELFELLMLFQTKKIRRVPIILVGSKFWKNLESFLRNVLLKEGKIDEQDLNLFKIIDDEDEIINLIKVSPIYDGDTVLS